MSAGREPRIGLDAGLLLLRLGVALIFILLFALKQSAGKEVFAYHPGRVAPLVALSLGALLVTCGWLTRPAAALMALAWAWAAYSGLHAGQHWFALPVRAALFVFLFAALALTGPGRYSLDGLRKGKASSL